METGLFSLQKGETSVLLFSSSPPPCFAEIKIRGKSTPAQNSGEVGLEQPKLTQQTDCQGRVGSLGLNQHSSHQGSQPLAAPTEPPPASLPSLPVQSWIIPVPTEMPITGCAAGRAPVPPAEPCGEAAAGIPHIPASLTSPGTCGAALLILCTSWQAVVSSAVRRV